MTCSHGGFIAQSVEHRTGIAEVMGSNPVGASDFFLGFLCDCLSYFTTAKITFTSIYCICLEKTAHALSVHKTRDTIHSFLTTNCT